MLTSGEKCGGFDGLYGGRHCDVDNGLLDGHAAIYVWGCRKGGLRIRNR